MIKLMWTSILIVSGSLWLPALDSGLDDHRHPDTMEACFMCDASLRDTNRLWCREHTRYEDRCFLCHPEIQDTNRAYCNTHFLYEDECFLCDPTLAGQTHGTGGTPAANNSCTTHGLALTQCFICDPKLRDPDRLWCREHGRYEDRCFLCHPDLEQVGRPYCQEHFLYEDECPFCNPSLSSNQETEVKTPDEPALFCHEHGVAEMECAICQPQLATTLAVGDSLKIRFESEFSAEKAGVITGLPNSTASKPGIEAISQLGYNQNAVALISPVVGGAIAKVYVETGSVVHQGDVLVDIHSVAISEAKTAYLSAMVDHRLNEKAYQREKTLMTQKIASMLEYQEAQAAFEKALFAKNTAYQRLLNFGYNKAAIQQIATTKDRSSTLSVKAPFDGTIVSRQVVMGESIAQGAPMFTLVDLSTMWLEMKIPVDKIALIERGQAVEATFQALPGYKAQGHLTWIDTSIDADSRMLKARAEVKNTGKLKSGMFGQAYIETDSARKAVQVPRDAIQYHERLPFVFVKEEDDLYALRRITLGKSHSNTAEILAGVAPHEQVVVTGAFTVMSEFLKSRLGAGCVH